MRFDTLSLLFVAICNHLVDGYVDWSEDISKEKWNRQAAETINDRLRKKDNWNVAKNVILFLGDGMGLSTITSGRILKGQLKGKNGEEEVTHMEAFPDVGLSKTYNIDTQTPDSAGTATAFLCGVKTRIGIIGLDGKAIVGDCKSSANAEIDSIVKWAHDAGKSVGIVTTTRITHATPAAAYAHSADRNWETYDGKTFTKKQDSEGCKDIAAQLIDDASYINLIVGGGRGYFLPNSVKDYGVDVNGQRVDGRNLIKEWTDRMQSEKKRSKFIWNATDFRTFNVNEHDHVLALLAYSHLEYETERDPKKEPSLAEMTEVAIKFLSQNKNGYFLLVEGGKIDLAHHESRAKKALYDFVKFDEAIGASLGLVSHRDTLIVATADHSHVFSLGGYALRGNDIFGLAYNQYQNISDANLTFTSLSYGNGPAGLTEIRTRNLTDEEVVDKEYMYESPVLLNFETHGGEDVAIYAKGPMSFLFDGTVEQSYIAHAMAYSACIGKYDTATCRRRRLI